jgi:hypothetical protein
MSRFLRVLSMIAILSSYGWIAFHIFFVGYVTWRLGHFPRVMIDDPKIILPNDPVYDALFNIVFGGGLISWIASFAIGLWVEIAHTRKSVESGTITGTRLHQWVLFGLVLLLVAPLLSFKLLFWLLD